MLHEKLILERRENTVTIPIRCTYCIARRSFVFRYQKKKGKNIKRDEQEAY